ncbi:MAG TPA: beta-galactosidase [Thermoleophilaceae bacterium]|nr:beta-galactosidase [Thermoleophilaceae bacterium]
MRLPRLAAFILASASLAGAADAAPAAPRPLIGAQVWIEPGQTPDEIDGWFRTLAESGMPVARLFLMWNYLEPAPGRWEFALYDAAFASAARHGVRVVATLTAHHGPPHRGYVYRSQGSRIVDTEERLVEAEEYVQQVVSRYAKSPALDTWMLMNEPGQPPSPDPLAVARFRDWLKAKYGKIDALNAAWLTSFASFDAIAYDERWTEGGWTWPAAFVDWHAFWREHLSWHLDWVAQRIRRSDPVHPIHVNPHALVDNLSGTSTDLPSWRPFVDSLGASIHPGWHFGLLERDQFALGVSYVCDLVRGAATPKPFWVTELQGGNNLYSATRPMNPTREDIAQWTWTAIGSGADRVVYWLLNARGQGGEAAEWSMLDFQQRPSERLAEAAAIAATLRKHEAVFADARPIAPRATVLLSLESMTLQDNYKWTDYPGRKRQAHLMAALGVYETLVEMGVPTEVRFVHDPGWRTPLASGAPRLAILAHATAISAGQAAGLEAFVRDGNTLLVTGLAGLFDPEARAWPLGRSPLEPVLGARMKEVRLVGEKGRLRLDQPPLVLPFHLWESEIEPLGATPIGREGERVTAVRHRLGKGEAVWVPSLIGLGAWLGDNEPLSQLFASLLGPARDALRQQAVTFAGRQPGAVLRVLESGSRLVAVVTNGEEKARTVRLATARKEAPTVVYGAATAVSSGEGGPSVALGPRGTVVLLWP